MPPARSGLRRRERRAWERLDALGRVLPAQPDEAAVLRVALPAVLDLFDADEAVAVLPGDGSAPGLRARLARSERGVTVSPLAGDPADLTTPDPDDLVLPLGDPPLGRVAVRRTRGWDGPRGRRTRDRVAAVLGHLVTGSLSALRGYDAQRRDLERQHALAALRDPLTGLGTRDRLFGEAEQVLARSTGQGRAAALLLLDLDGFKRVNDTLGHPAGDRALAEIGRRVTAVLRESDLAVRLGGDEFVVLAGGLAEPEDAVGVAERLQVAVAEGIEVEEVEVCVRASVGIAVHGRDGETLEDLLLAADQAMYRAKAGGPGQWRLASDGSRTVAGADLLPALQEVLAAGSATGDQLVLHHQPQVDARTGAVTGFEALLRWQHPQHGLLSPRDFVPLAERNGLGGELTLRVLERALTDHAALRAHAPEASVSVNLSARNLLDPGLVDAVAQRLADAGTEPHRLVLEITEPAPDPSPQVRALFAALEKLGCSVSVHEFGSGHSSLSALSQYPAIREIKVEPDLVRGVADDPDTARVVRAMTQMAHGLDVHVVAEGVETAAQRDALRGIGCDVLQGYLVGKPAPRAEVEAWLAGWAARRRTVLALPDG